jgi:hypothetical protein
LGKFAEFELDMVFTTCECKWGFTVILGPFQATGLKGLKYNLTAELICDSKQKFGICAILTEPNKYTITKFSFSFIIPQ